LAPRSQRVAAAQSQPCHRMRRAVWIFQAILVAILLSVPTSAVPGTTRDAAPAEVTVVIAGQGRVSSDPSGIDCSPFSPSPTAPCSAEFADNTTVTLTAQPLAGWRVDSWTGCDVLSPDGIMCTINLGVSPRTVISTWVPAPPFVLTVTPSFFGRVIATPPGVECDYSGEEGFANYDNCGILYDDSTEVRLDARAAPGSRFVGWDDSRCPSSPSCSLPVTQNHSVRAFFDPVPFAVYMAVEFDPSENPFVVSEPRGIRCPFACESAFRAGTAIRLKVVGMIDEIRWGLGCVPDQDDVSGRTCSAPANTYFVTLGVGGASPPDPPFLLTVPFRVRKAGSGTITGRGINCGADCYANYEWGDSVRLTATPSPGWRFGRWRDGCAKPKRPRCRVVPGEISSIQARFRRL